MTDQESKVEEEEMLVTSTMNSTEINTKNPYNKSLLLPQLSNKSLKNKKFLRNPKNPLWLSTTNPRVSILPQPTFKRKFQSRDKSTPNGLRRKS